MWLTTTAALATYRHDDGATCFLSLAIYYAIPTNRRANRLFERPDSSLTSVHRADPRPPLLFSRAQEDRRCYRWLPAELSPEQAYTIRIESPCIRMWLAAGAVLRVRTQFGGGA